MATDTTLLLDEIDKIQESRERKRRESVQMISKSDLDQLDQGIAAVEKLQETAEETTESNPFDNQRLDVFVDIERLADQLQMGHRSLTREQAVALALEQRQEIYNRAVLMKQENPELGNLDLDDFAVISKILEEQVTEAEQIAKRFERDPKAYDGLIFQDPSQSDFYQSEVRRLAEISKVTQPPDHTGRKIAAEAASRLAKQLQAQDPSLSDVDALSKAYEQQPNLYMR
jgi:hypothetical protein